MMNKIYSSKHSIKVEAKMEKLPPNEKLIVKFMKLPLRALCKVRDLYVKSMTNWANTISCSVYPSTLPRSFSVPSSRPNSEEDVREVMRMMMARRIQERNGEMTTTVATTRAPVGPKGLSKSYSVAIGRIDEEKPCYFEEDNEKGKGLLFYPRSIKSRSTNKLMHKN